MAAIITLASILAGFLLFYHLAKSARTRLAHIPAVGPSGLFSSYFGVFRGMLRSREMVVEGYKTYANGVFRVPLFHTWLVYCSGPELVDEFRKAHDSELSIHKSAEEIIQARYTLGQEIVDNDYHVAALRYSLSRNLAACFPDIYDEVRQALEDNLSLNGYEWKALHTMNLASSIVSRATNRLLLGLPLCRDPEFLKVNMQFTKDVMIVAYTLRSLPRFLRPLVGRLISKRDGYQRRVHNIVGDMLRKRLEMEDRHGKQWPDKPNDIVSWLIEKAPPIYRTVEDLVLRILTINFAGIHSTSNTLTHALYHLAAEPEHAAVLREEVDAILQEEGWTKAGIDRMIKLDSFLRESQRINVLTSMTMTRVAVKDFTFSNGTVIPAGTNMAVPLYAVHYDESIWPEPHKFDPYRSSRAREHGDDAKHQMVTPSMEFLTWGYGKHACPGRFFAVNELKTILAHIVHSYDVKFEKEGVRPANLWFAGISVPNMNAEVMFRRRV